MPAARARSTLARAPAPTLASTARRPLPCSRAGGNANNRVRDGRRPDGGDPAQLEGSAPAPRARRARSSYCWMDCYLVQHGEATPEQDDPARPLTDRGRREVEPVAEAAKRSGVGIAEIVHSGKIRAPQTAELLAAARSPV